MSLEIRIIGKGCFFCNELRKIVDDLVVAMGNPDATVEIGGWLALWSYREHEAFFRVSDAAGATITMTGADSELSITAN